MNLTTKERLVISHVNTTAGIPFSFVSKSKVISSCNERGMSTKSVIPVMTSLIKKGYLVKGNDTLAITPKVYEGLK